QAKGKAWCLPALGQSDQGSAAVGYSHHQKQIVIDHQKTFVGGIDLAYGRRDDANFDLKAGWRALNEVYNSCLPPIHKTTHVELRDCVTTAELIAAAFTPGDLLRDGAAWVASPADLMAGTYDAIHTGVDKAKATAAAVGDFLRIDLIDDIKAAVQDKIVDGALDTARWGWSQLAPDFRERIKGIINTQGGNAANAVSAVYAWLQGGDISLLPPRLMGEVRHLVEALVFSIVAATHAAASGKSSPYQRLFDKVSALPASDHLIDPKTQPRMPWQDVHCCIEGPAVYDFAKNFVRRWNGSARQLEKSFARYRDPAAAFLLKQAGLELPRSLKAPRLARIPARHLPPPPIIGRGHVGTCWVQALRSAPIKMQADEAAADTAEPTAEQAAAARPAALAQNNCLKGILKLIVGAQHFLYIEGQFFQSAHGAFGPTSAAWSGPMGILLDLTRSPAHQRFAATLGIAGVKPEAFLDHLRWDKIDDVLRDPAGAQYVADLKTVLKNLATVEAMRLLGAPQDRLINPVGTALIERIERAIDDKTPFHVYLVLPVHPEGTLDTLNIMSQTHLTMHSLVFGDNSLINGVRRAILVNRTMREKKIDKAAALKVVGQMDPRKFREAVGDEWKNYLTLLNLRNWDTLNGQPVTEQIYVHSKLIIADDRAAFLGSANINDRSLLGGRDSELGAIITDDAEVKVKLDGVHPVGVGLAIHKLRRSLWEKHFGLKSANRKAPALAGAEILDSPAAPGTWKAIQKVAAKNAESYEAAFWFIPRSVPRPEIQPKKPTDPDPPPASLWPTWQYKDYEQHAQGGRLLYRMPFDPLFWRAAERGETLNSWNEKVQLAKPTEPKGIQGFITALPINWTCRENNLAAPQ
ncbi:MAG: hypothetical protein LBV49_09315, partial [Azonexus sp.]|nr:hypothetical protein [Azonexus sp.]